MNEYKLCEFCTISPTIVRRVNGTMLDQYSFEQVYVLLEGKFVEDGMSRLLII